MFNIEDFNVVSTECDLMLLFSSDYRRVVTKAINQIMTESHKEKADKLQLVCYKSIVIIQDKRVNPEFFSMQILEDYDPTEDLEESTI